jgi:hypothetical protein
VNGSTTIDMRGTWAVPPVRRELRVAVTAGVNL